MILQALTHYYEALLVNGEVARPGWVEAKVPFALQLDVDGRLIRLLHLQVEQQRGKKLVMVPRTLSVPAPAKRSMNIAASFLCDKCSYMLGVSDGDGEERALKCFAESKELHQTLLRDIDAPAARAVVRFFAQWEPSRASEHPALQEDWSELVKGGNLVFWYGEQPVTQIGEIQQVWQRQYERSGGKEVFCPVIGRRAPLARLHPSIKGVFGAQSSGASLVSFNAPAFCSYEHEQGENAPTSEYAAFAYTSALNRLIGDRDHMCRVGDTTIVCWAEDAQSAYQDFVMESLYDDNYGERDILQALQRLSAGEAIDWQQARLKPEMRFYVLGLAPNAARLSVRFFWTNSFGTMARNVYKHYVRLNIVRPAFDKVETLSIWRLTRETVNLNARTPEPNPRLAGELLLAVLNNGFYPATLLNGVAQRIRAERNLTRGRAAILKAYYLQNSKDEQLKEVMTVNLNEQSKYLPYVLGRMFAVLEYIQAEANPGINTTIKDRYFNAASSMPLTVFPVLINLAQKHLAKLSKDEKRAGLGAYLERKLTELNGRIDQTLPKHMTLAEQSAFQIGYYHEVQRRYAKKEEQ